MAIDISQVESRATVTIGVPAAAPLYEGDTLEAVYVLAEAFDSEGSPIEPAPFFTQDGGWGLEVVMDAASSLVPTVDQPTSDNGQVVVRLALGESLGKLGKHRGNVRAFNPVVGGRTQQRTLFNLAIMITEAPP